MFGKIQLDFLCVCTPCLLVPHTVLSAQRADLRAAVSILQAIISSLNVFKATIICSSQGLKGGDARGAGAPLPKGQMGEQRAWGPFRPEGATWKYLRMR